jgi:hypothetical protein
MLIYEIYLNHSFDEEWDELLDKEEQNLNEKI